MKTEKQPDEARETNLIWFDVVFAIAAIALFVACYSSFGGFR